MDKKLNFKFKIGDFIAICFIFFLAIVVFIAYIVGNKSGEDAKVQIYQNNVLIQEFPLNSTEDITYTVEGRYINTIIIRDGEVFIEYANCPGTDCVHSGSISSVGRTLVCLPNKVEVRIIGCSDMDFVVG